ARTNNAGASWQIISPTAYDPNNHPNRRWHRVWTSTSDDNTIYAHRTNDNWQAFDDDAFRLYKHTNCNALPGTVTWSWVEITPSLLTYNNGNKVHRLISDLTTSDENNDE